MEFRWCVIADDFTGAGDAGIQFCQPGFPVIFGLQNWMSIAEEGEYSALALSTESRFSSSSDAYRAVSEAVAMCRCHRIERYFKKIDSTVRGNVADEIAALMDATGYKCTVVAPAVPKNGRTVVDGHCLIDGSPVGSTEHLNDRITPVQDSFVPALFKSRFPGAVGHVGLSDLRLGAGKFRNQVAGLRAEGKRVIVVDAESMEDLGVVATLISDPTLLFAGASGLAEALAGKRPSSLNAEIPSFLPGEIVFVVGSISQISTEQVKELKRAVPLGIISPDVLNLLENEEQEFLRLMKLAESFPVDGPVIIETSDNRKQDTRIDGLARRNGYTQTSLAEKISGFIARVVAALREQRSFRVFFVTGGDTAAKVAEELGAFGIELQFELLPGIPLGRLVAHHSAPATYLVTKAGGFGTKETMIRILQIMTDRIHNTQAVRI